MNHELLKGEEDHLPDLLITEIETLKVFTHPLRSKILQRVTKGPCSVHQIAEELGVPFTRLYYHFQQLERAGFIRVVEKRPVHGGVAEKFYRVAFRNARIARELWGRGTEPSETLEVIMNEVLDEARRRAMQAAADGVINFDALPPHPEALFLKIAYLNLTREQAEAMSRQIIALIDAHNAIDHAEGDVYTFSILLHPVAKRLPEGG